MSKRQRGLRLEEQKRIEELRQGMEDVMKGGLREKYMSEDGDGNRS